MDHERLSRVREALEEAGVDALVSRLPENVFFLSGHWPLCGWTFYAFPRQGRPLCIAPHCDEAEAAAELWDADLQTFPFGILSAGNPYEEIAGRLKTARKAAGWSTVGCESGFESVSPSWNTAEPAIPAAATRRLLEKVFGADRLTDATELLNGLRACKTELALEGLRRVNEISTFGLRAFQEAVVIGVTGVELVAAVEHAIMTQGTGYHGAVRVRAFAQVATGPAETAKGYRPMEISTTRKMEHGDVALLELGVVADGYWADRTRVRVAGKPTAEQQKVFDIVKRAQNAAIATVRSGVPAGDVDEAARAVVRLAGYGERFFHVTGHGLGFRYHEPIPLIAPGVESVLETGMVHSVEPGIYYPEMGGIRLEDDVVVTEVGAEVLGPFESELAG